jgi:hypothetical protein
MPVPAAASDDRCHTAAESQEMYSSSVISSPSVCWAVTKNVGGGWGSVIVPVLTDSLTGSV